MAAPEAGFNSNSNWIVSAPLPRWKSLLRIALAFRSTRSLLAPMPTKVLLMVPDTVDVEECHRQHWPERRALVKHSHREEDGVVTTATENGATCKSSCRDVDVDGVISITI